jgi:WD40 repeat protein
MPVQRKTVLGKHNREIIGVAFAADGKTLASSSWDGTIRLWDVASGKELHKLDEASKLAIGVALSADGKTAATGAQGAEKKYNVKLWDVPEGKEREKLGEDGDVQALAFSPDGKTLAWSSDFFLKLFDLSKKEAKSFNEGDWTIIRYLAFTRDGKTLAVGDEYAIHAFDPATGKGRAKMKRDADQRVLSWAIAPDGSTMAYGDSKGTLRIMDLASGAEKPPRTEKGQVRGLAYSPGGKMLAVASDNGLTFLDVASGKVLATVGGDLKEIAGKLAFSRDGRTLAVATVFGEILLFDMLARK